MNETQLLTLPEESKDYIKYSHKLKHEHSDSLTIGDAEKLYDKSVFDEWTISDVVKGFYEAVVLFTKKDIPPFNPRKKPVKGINIKRLKHKA